MNPGQLLREDSIHHTLPLHVFSSESTGVHGYRSIRAHQLHVHSDGNNPALFFQAIDNFQFNLTGNKQEGYGIATERNIDFMAIIGALSLLGKRTNFSQIYVLSI